MESPEKDRYVAPGRFTTHVFNPAVAWLTRRGFSVWGSRVLEVPGRISGEVRATPVNLLEVEGSTYLVSPRGETQWVRNLRAARAGRLRLGRCSTPFTAVELDTADRPTVLRPYLRRWRFEVGAFFEGVSADATDAELASVAHRHPVFLVTLGAPGRATRSWPARSRSGPAGATQTG